MVGVKAFKSMSGKLFIQSLKEKNGLFFSLSPPPFPPPPLLILQVKVGDTLDLILGEDKETETAVVMRVVLRKASEKNENDKYKVVLRRWKNLKVPKQDVLK